MEKGTKKTKGIAYQLIYMATGVFPMMILSIVVTILALAMLKTRINNGEYNTLRAAAYGIAEYFEHDIREEGDVDYEEFADHKHMESLQVIGIEQTLFKGNVRYLTSIKNSNGEYLEGTTASDEVWKKISNGEDVCTPNVMIDGTAYYVYYTPVYADEEETEIWGAAFAGEKMSVMNAAVAKVTKNLYFVVFASSLVMFFLLIRAGRAYSKTLKRLSADVQRFANGDVWHKNSISSICMEYNEIAASLNDLTDSLSSSVDTIQGTADSVEIACANVDKLAEETASGAEKISQVVGELAVTASSMAEKVQDANSSIIDMGESINSISNLSEEAAKRANEMSKENAETLTQMKVVLKSNESTVDAITKINEQTEACTVAVGNISSATDVIAEIASQTNLLALNASIEAARAGEAGRGFAVVAENIRALAEQSTKSAQEIGMNVQNVVSKVSTCAEMAVDAKSQMEQQQTLVKEIAEKLDKLGAAVTEVNSDIDAVSEEANALNVSKNDILGSIADLSAISEENAASAEEVSATVEGLSDGAISTQDEADRMKGMSDALKEKLTFFHRTEE